MSKLNYTDEQMESLICIREAFQVTTALRKLIGLLEEAGATENLLRLVKGLHNEYLVKMREAQDEFERTGGLDEAFRALD